MKVTLTMNERQAYTLMSALDLYSRIKMGQFRAITSMFPRRSFDYTITERYLDAAKREIFPDLDWNSSYGIFSSEVGDGQSAWDIHQVIRHDLSWHKHPEGGWTVNFDEPMAASSEPLPTVTIEDESPPVLSGKPKRTRRRTTKDDPQTGGVPPS